MTDKPGGPAPAHYLIEVVTVEGETVTIEVCDLMAALPVLPDPTAHHFKNEAIGKVCRAGHKSARDPAIRDLKAGAHGLLVAAYFLERAQGDG